MRIQLILAAACSLAAVEDGTEPAPPLAPVYTAPAAPVQAPAEAPAAAEGRPTERRAAPAATPATARCSVFSVTALLGRKWLDEDDWGDLHEQRLFGIQGSFSRRTWPVALVANLHVSGDSTGDTSDIDDLDNDEWDEDDAWYEEPDQDGRSGAQGRVLELQVGVGRTWDLPARFRLGVGGGLSLVAAELAVDDATTVRHDADRTAGVWASGQAFWTFRGFVIGPQAGWSYGEARLFTEDVRVGGAHLGLLLGWRH